MADDQINSGSAVLSYAAERPPPLEFARWTHADGTVCALLPTARVLPRLIPVALALSMTIAASIGLLAIVLQSARLVGWQSDTWGPLLIASPFVWGATEATISACRILAHRAGVMVEVSGGRLRVWDRSARGGRIDVPIKAIRDLRLQVAGWSAYAAQRVLFRVELVDGHVRTCAVWTDDATWFGRLEVVLRDAMRLGHTRRL